MTSRTLPTEHSTNVATTASILLSRNGICSARAATMAARCPYSLAERVNVLRDPSLRAQAAELLRGSATLASAPQSCTRASLVAEVAIERLAAGATTSSITNELVYVG